MITGVETAGLVLAVFPLVIKGLKAWKEGAESVKSWRMTRQVLKQYIMKAENQHVSFEQTMELLLLDIVESPEDLKDMLQDPKGNLWQDTDYEEQVKFRLGGSYDQFVDTTQRMELLLSQIHEILSLHRPGTSYTDMSRFDRGVFGWKLMIGKKTLMDVLDEIKEANKFLYHTVDQSHRLEPSRRKRRTKRVGKAIKSIQKQATSLYNALFSSNCWTCGCRDQHVASLRLEIRLSDQAMMSPVFKLRMMLAASTPDNEHWIGRSWRDVEVQSCDTNRPPLQKHTSQRSEQHVKKSTKVTSISMKKSTRFAIDEAPPVVTETILAFRSNTTNGLQPISDLCDTMRRILESRNEIGYLMDPNNATIGACYQHNLSVTCVDDSSEVRTISLETLLKDSSNAHTRLSRADRLHIAANLASSVLQLDATPWLMLGWKSSDISFHSLDTGSESVTKRSLTMDPYLSARPGQARRASKAPADPFKLLISHGIRNVKLLSLAFVLIELSLGKTLEELAIEEDKDANEVISRRKTATRVHENVFYESGIPYGEVVQTCLFCSFKMRDVSFENEDFQQAFHDDVVTPLANDLKHFQGVPV